MIITLSHIRKIISFEIPKFLCHFRGSRRLFPFNGVLFTQEIQYKIIPLCMDYDVAFRLGKTRS